LAGAPPSRIEQTQPASKILQPSSLSRANTVEVDGHEADFERGRIYLQPVIVVLWVHKKRIRDNGFSVVSERPPLCQRRDLVTLLDAPAVFEKNRLIAATVNQIVIRIRNCPFGPAVTNEVQDRVGQRLIEDIAPKVIASHESMHVFKIRREIGYNIHNAEVGLAVYEDVVLDDVVLSGMQLQPIPAADNDVAVN
jgi:hypothetical protein